ncbi:MAG: C10 family peptidase, partial [Bacteroidota bacterium]
IIQNIIDSLPVHLAVVDPSWSSGHNVVIDGYNTDNYYHLNFGWGGASNGWYLLPDGIPYSLTVIEGVIVDIYPDQSTSAGTVSTCDFSIWPNPAYNRVNVSLSGINGHGKLLLTDIRGIPVLEREFSIRKENIQLNIEGIPAGVYLLNLHTEKDNKAVKLIVY